MSTISVCLISENGGLFFGPMADASVIQLQKDLAEVNKNGSGYTITTEVLDKGTRREIVSVDVLIPLVCWKDELTERLDCPN